jgi:magnesium chelatase family protein
VLPAANACEMRLLPGLAAFAAAHLLEVWAHLSGKSELPAARSLAVSAPGARPAARAADAPPPDAAEPDPGAIVAPLQAERPLSLADVCGQSQAKRALRVAAAGGHSLLLIGPPGCGKSMLAQRLPSLLPELTETEAIDVAAVASVAGAAGIAGAWPVPRPFRAPHHTASAGAIIGGGAQARPGEITLAHLGVLFLDEFPEFDRRVLEALREPLESGVVSISRAGLQAEYPARFQLVAAMNPCPCGHLGDRMRSCRCKPPEVARYRSRLSGPLLDRIDLRVSLEAVSEADLDAHRAALASGAAQANATTDATRLRRARACQLARQGRLNADLAGPEIECRASLTREASAILAQARERLGLSLRGTHRTQRVARTLADLDGVERVDVPHVAEAIQLRRALLQD